MRSLVQYDFDEPAARPSDTRRPPVKRRKRNHSSPQKSQMARAQKKLVQHWDDPESPAVGMIYDEQEGSTAFSVSVNTSVGSLKATTSADNLEEEEYGEEVIEADHAGEKGGEGGEEESRELTHEEIWDDSALIDAWNSAEAEYEAYHGTSKSWREEPVKRSPLWYNKPWTAPSKPQAQEDGELEPDTAPLDFHTFVPTHDPSLSVPADSAAASPCATTTSPFFVTPTLSTTVSRDEAFNNALSAMYWCGYWTAVYQSKSRDDVTGEAIKENGVEADEDDDDGDLVPAQR